MSEKEAPETAVATTTTTTTTAKIKKSKKDEIKDDLTLQKQTLYRPKSTDPAKAMDTKIEVKSTEPKATEAITEEGKVVGDANEHILGPEKLKGVYDMILLFLK